MHVTKLPSSKQIVQAENNRKFTREFATNCTLHLFDAFFLASSLLQFAFSSFHNSPAHFDGIATRIPTISARLPHHLPLASITHRILHV